MHMIASRGDVSTFTDRSILSTARCWSKRLDVAVSHIFSNSILAVLEVINIRRNRLGVRGIRVPPLFTARGIVPHFLYCEWGVQ
jgi:hypothetical protein